MDMHILEQTIDPASFVLPSNILAGIHVPHHIRSTYPSHLEKPRRRLPLRVARVKTRTLERLRQIKLGDSDRIHALCMTDVGGGAFPGPVCPDRWRNCAQEILRNLKNNLHATQDLQANVDTLMGVVGSIITMDLKHFADQVGFHVSVVQDRIGRDDETLAPSWHTDPSYRAYLMRTRRAAQFLDYRYFQDTNYMTQEHIYRRLLEVASEKLPRADIRVWGSRLEDRNMNGQFDDLEFESEIASEITLFAKQMNLIWQPKDGEVVMADDNSWHISGPPEPDAPPCDSILINVTVMRPTENRKPESLSGPGQ